MLRSGRSVFARKPSVTDPAMEILHRNTVGNHAQWPPHDAANKNGDGVPRRPDNRRYGADRLWGAPLPISALRRRQDAALTAFGRGVEAALAGNRRAPSAACRWPRRNAVNLSLGEPAPS